MADTNSSEVDRLARIVWDYQNMHQQVQKCDAIFVLCSYDPKVAERAAELFLDGYGDYILLSGGSSKITRKVFDKAEAEVFADIIASRGVPRDKMVIENKSTNTGENIRFTYALLKERGLHPRSLLLVQKPYMERRTFATFKKQWPIPATEICVTSPQVSYEQYFDKDNPKERVINSMVGDLLRVKEYPKRGLQIEQEIPPVVWAAGQRLIAVGFDKHPLPPS